MQSLHEFQSRLANLQTSLGARLENLKDELRCPGGGAGGKTNTKREIFKTPIVSNLMWPGIAEPASHLSEHDSACTARAQRTTDNHYTPTDR